MKYNPKIVIAYFKECGIPAPELESQFDKEGGRKWRFDFAWWAQAVALEVEGGIYMPKGGHTSVSGIKRDMEKYNTAAQYGWRILRVTPDDLCTQDTVNMIKRCLNV